MPFTSAKPADSRDHRIVTFSRVGSFEAEQYRRLRHRIEELAARRPAQVVAVTSATSGEGKTLTSVNLAGALAQNRTARVLLLDADLREPRVAQACGMPADQPGLVALLRRNGRELRSSVVRVDGAALDVLSCERTRVDPYEALRSDAFASVIAQARRDYQFVIVDTPPMVPVPDSGLLDTLIDGYLLVVAANLTPRKLVGEALNSLDPRSLLGLVFNRDPQPLFGYYDSYSHRYFGTDAPEFEPANPR